MQDTETHPIKSETPKCMDLLKYKAMQIMFRARNKLLPKNIWGMFTEGKGRLKSKGLGWGLNFNTTQV